MINAVIVALGPGAAALYEPEQEHVCDQPEDGDENCDCPVVDHDCALRVTVTTQDQREEILAQALEAAGGGIHFCWDEDSDPPEDHECDCDLSPLIPVILAAEEPADAGYDHGVEWGKWLAAVEVTFERLDHVVMSLPLPWQWRRDIAHDKDASISEVREKLGGPPLSEPLTICEGVARWAAQR